MSGPKSNELTKLLYKFPKPNRWQQGIGAELPEAYKKFWKEWKLDRPKPVHWIDKEGKYERWTDGTIRPIQNVDIPLKYPKELDKGIWGGEAVIQGMMKPKHKKRRYVHYWVPQLKRSVVYSEILNKYMNTIVTDRTLNLIHQHYGFDHYILSTKACDLRSLLALNLKRNMLIALYDKTLYPDDPVKQEEVYEKYKHYTEGYTREEIEWYGYSYEEACKMLMLNKKKSMVTVPLKVKFREELIQMLKEEKLELVKDEEPVESEPKSWLSKLNIFKSNSNKSATE
ncbi:39S ribosomal protein L28, mitochondrial [Trichogramma pretiosum]|uniref:39S ribosomal protein L28, mitochondrial n=1 Tax=Trichogramma pretiosum TaxID=7493 RepID=UPI0006C9ABE6|nr:39S ribosomal protein L28, mitochondrial [Trichogramma pretiosum]